MAAQAAPLKYTDLPLDMRGMIMDHVIRMTEGSYKTLVRSIAALHTLDREACSNIWRTSFEKVFGAIPGAVEGETKYCPYLLGVHTWREAFLRTVKELNALPSNEKWRWEHMPLWSQKGMDARLALLGFPVPAGARADLLRARGASILRFNASIRSSRDLRWCISSIRSDRSNEDAQLLEAKRLIDERGANAAYVDPTDPNDLPALFCACTGTSTRAVRFLLDNGARMLLNHARGGSEGEEAPRTPLTIARSSAMITLLLEERADPNHYVVNKYGKVHALTVAVKEKDTVKVRALLQAGADPNADGERALVEARKYQGQQPTVLALLEERATMLAAQGNGAE